MMPLMLLLTMAWATSVNVVGNGQGVGSLMPIVCIVMELWWHVTLTFLVSGKLSLTMDGHCGISSAVGRSCCTSIGVNIDDAGNNADDTPALSFSQSLGSKYSSQPSNPITNSLPFSVYGYKLQKYVVAAVL